MSSLHLVIFRLISVAALMLAPLLSEAHGSYSREPSSGSKSWSYSGGGIVNLGGGGHGAATWGFIDGSQQSNPGTGVQSDPNSEGQAPATPTTPVTAPTRTGLDCAGKDSASSVCVCMRNQSACSKTESFGSNTSSRNAESAGTSDDNNSKESLAAAKAAAEAKAQAVLDSMPSGAGSGNGNIVMIVPGQTIQTRPVAKPQTPEEIAREKKKTQSTDIYAGDQGSVSRAPAGMPSTEEPVKIAWSYGSKKKKVDYEPEGPPQGYTGPGGRSNFEKVRQRYYDMAGTFDRPDTLPPTQPSK